jgi:flagellar FliL protein
VITNAEENLPMIQDALRTLFSEQTLEAVNSVDGRKQLQASALESLQTLLKEETGNDDLEGVYFTSFVLQ